eukprot:m.198043 g.198043  ORF g.198043 m.198043 type:complete len:68 (-) comp18730_c0_seq1:8-211(-)
MWECFGGSALRAVAGAGVHGGTVLMHMTTDGRKGFHSLHHGQCETLLLQEVHAMRCLFIATSYDMTM